MKQSGEIFEEAWAKAQKEGRKDILVTSIIYSVEMAQKEAWNEAIDAAAENADICEVTDINEQFLCNDIDKESILKLKK